MGLKEDLLKIVFSEPELKYWSYDNDYLSCYYEKEQTYDIPISELHTPCGVCEWLGQINEKSWASKEMLGEMVVVINHIVGDLRSFQVRGKGNGVFLNYR